MKKNKKFILIALAALLLRFSVFFVGYHGDLNNNISWGKLAVERGLVNFYEGESWTYSSPNQPPLTILMFYSTHYVWQGIENASWWLNNNIGLFPSPFIWFWEEKGLISLVKLPSVIADILIAWIIYEYIRKKKNIKTALAVASVWLFNPITWYNSSIWGQTDSIVNLLGLASLIYLLDKKLIKSLVLFTASFLFKGSLAIFMPVFAFVALKQNHKRKDWIKGLLASLSLVVFVSVWFHPAIDLFTWLFNLYQKRIIPGEIGYLTANAFNFWWLVDPGKVLDSTKFVGIPARLWGFVISLGFIGYIIRILNKKITDKRIFFSLIVVSLVTFLFMTRIHERYLYPFFPLATVLLAFFPAILYPYVVLSITYTLNMYNLFWEPGIGFLENMLKMPLIPQIISAVNIFIFLLLLRHFRLRKL